MINFFDDVTLDVNTSGRGYLRICKAVVTILTQWPPHMAANNCNKIVTLNIYCSINSIYLKINKSVKFISYAVIESVLC